MLLARLLAAGVHPDYAPLILAACAEHDLPVDYALALLEAETGRTRTRAYHGANIYGHDLNACMTVAGTDVEVTEANYSAYLACVAAGGRRNGVGPYQVTHWSLQDAAGPRLWDPAVSIPFALGHFARLLRSPATATATEARLATAAGKPVIWAAYRRYNGKVSYADRVMLLLPAWTAVVAEPPSQLEAEDAMTYALLDRPNPTGPNFYSTRNRPPGAPSILAIVEHITAGLQDLDATDDQSAEGVVRYAQTTTRDVSWHVSTDSDSTIELLPPAFTAWHASNYNSTTYGHEHSKLSTDWRNVPALWLDRTLRQGAQHDAKIAKQYGIPIRKAARAELDREIAKGAAGRPVGFIGHWEIDPTRRDDPGRIRGTQLDTFPWVRYLDLVRYYANEGDDDMSDPNIIAFLATGGVSTRVTSMEQAKKEGVDPTSLFGRVLDVQLALTAALPVLVTAAQQGVRVDPTALEAVLASAIDRAVDAAFASVAVELDGDQIRAIAYAVRHELAAGLSTARPA